MSLVVGWRCRDGLVVHADSQETDPEGYRIAVQKITPERMGKFDVVMAGSGIGELVDSFVQRMADRMCNDRATALPDFKKIFEQQYREFAKDDVKDYPAPRKSKGLSFIVGAVSASAGRCELWTTKAGRLRPIHTYDLVGWPVPFYKHIAGRFYSLEMPMSQAVLAGVYLLSIAEQTCNFVKGPVSVVILKPSGIYVEDCGYISDMEERLKSYSAQVDRIFMSCSDTSVYLSELDRQLTDFKTQATLLHKVYLASVVHSMVDGGLGTVNDPYARIPPGFTLSLAAGDMDDVITADEKREIASKIEEWAKRSGR